MITFFKAIDIYGDHFYLNIDGKCKHKTVFGGISTILFSILLAIATFLFGSDFFFKLNSRVVSQRTVNKTSESIIPTTRNFSLAFRVEDDIGNLIDFSELGIKMTAAYYSGAKSEEGTAKLFNEHHFEIKRCHSIPALKTNEIDPTFDLSNYYCIDWDEIKDFTPFLGGYWDESKIGYLILQLNSCSKRGAEDCASVKKMRKMMENQTWYFSVFYPSYFFDTESFNNPIKTLFETNSLEISAYTAIVQDAKMQIATLTDDKGWIFKDESIHRATSLDSVQTTFNTIVDDDIGSFRIFEYNLYFGRAAVKMERSFVKIQEVAAEVGGIIKLINLCFRFLVNYYSNFDMMRGFAAKMENESQQTSRFSGSTISVSNIQENNQNKGKSTQISFLDYFLGTFSKRRSFQFKKTVSEIEKHFEINKLLELFKKFEQTGSLR